MAATNQISTSPYLLSDANQATYNYGQLPPDQALEEQALNRRQHIANLLIQQGLANAGANHGQMVGRFYVPGSPVQNLAGLASIAAGAYGTYKGDEARKDLTAKSNDILAQAVKAYHEKTSPTELNTGEAEGPGAPVQTATAGEGFTPEELAQPAGGHSTMKEATDALFAQRSPAYFQEGPRPQAGTTIPATPEARQQALVDLMASQHPQAQNLGRLLQQQQAAQGERDTNREFLKSESDLNRQNRLDVAREGFGKDMVLASVMGANKDQLAALQRSHDLALESMRGTNRKEVAQIGADAKVDVQGMKSGPNRPMSATAQKELIQTEEELQGSHQAVEHLKSALALNDKAMGFTGAGAIAGAGSFLPDAIRPKAVDATVDLENLIQGSTLPQLKAIFGGMPTEGERKILLDVAGSASKTPSQRKAIFERAIQGAQNRITFNTQKAEQLRKGTYFSGDGGMDTSAAPNPVSPLVGGGQQAAPSGGLTPAEQQELETLKKKYGR